MSDRAQRIRNPKDHASEATGAMPTGVRLAKQVAAFESSAMTPDRNARTAPARRAFDASWERKVDPDGLLPAADRQRRADAERKAHYARMALASARSRRKARELIAQAEAAEAELDAVGAA